MKLLKTIEQLMHAPMRAVYPITILIETLDSLMKIKHGNNKSIINDLERFKSEKNTMTSLFGQKLLDRFIKNTQEYREFLLGSDLADRHVDSKKRATNKFLTMLFIRGSDYSMYDSLLVDWHKVYANE